MGGEGGFSRPNTLSFLSLCFSSWAQTVGDHHSSGFSRGTLFMTFWLAEAFCGGGGRLGGGEGLPAPNPSTPPLTNVRWASNIVSKRMIRFFSNTRWLFSIETRARRPGAEQMDHNTLGSDRCRHFLNRCNVSKVAKHVQGNQSDKYCNRSDTGPSKLLLELY